jgi:pimeloyl-ACP methyl ester carboxylesterase
VNDGRRLETARGTRVRVLEGGAEAAPPLLFLHGLSGLLDDTTLLDRLAERHHVFAPELPGYGDSSGEQLLEDMLDFALHGWDVVAALGLGGRRDPHATSRSRGVPRRPALVGHSLGGMVAAEMACLAPDALGRLVLIDPFGLWLDEHPIPDLFSFLPFEFGEVLFRDPARGAALLTGGLDFSDVDALREFFVGNARRLGTAGKLLFPIPNRRLAKRLYRLTTETLIVWGECDRLIPAVYADRWAELIPHARLVRIPDAGHMLPYEQPEPLAEHILAFLA